MMNKIQTPFEVISDNELKSLIHLIKKVHSFDFSHYTRASFKRRIIRLMELEKLSYFDLTNQLVNNAAYFDHFLAEVTVNTTEMFRDPQFFKAVKESIIPYLKSYQHIKVWSAGCSTGEELYSLAILFLAENVYDRSFFYGTDVNQEVLVQAKEGIYNLQKMKLYSENFIQLGTNTSLSNYYTAQYDAAALNRSLKQNILLSVHNLASDGAFNEFQLITCRNVLIYFDLELQTKVIALFYDSLANFGFLCLGAKESIRDSDLSKKFKIIDKKNNIFQKIG